MQQTRKQTKNKKVNKKDRTLENLTSNQHKEPI